MKIHIPLETPKSQNFGVFGSCARMEERPESDVDFLVKLGDDIGLLEYCEFAREISRTLGREVDLTRNTALRNDPRFAARVCAEAVAI